MFSVRSSVPPYFKWLSNLSWFKYGNEALLVNQWATVDSIMCTRANTTCPKDGHVVLETYNFKDVSIRLVNSKNLEFLRLSRPASIFAGLLGHGLLLVFNIDVSAPQSEPIFSLRNH